jgi:hypothetical protein
MEEHLDFDLLDLEPVFPSLEGFPELSFQDGEHGFDLVSLMVLIQIKRFHHLFSIIPGDLFSFSIPNWDERSRVQRIPDQPVDLFGVVSFVHDIEVGLSGSVSLFQEFFSVRDIVDRVLGYFQAGDNLLRCIDSDRGFQEPFSGFSGSHRIVVAGIGAGEPGGIDSGTGNSLAPVVEHHHEPVE